MILTRVKTTIRQLKKLLREAILGEDGPSASATDPTTSADDGFYDYDEERGTDIFGVWDMSPGQPPGTAGDPYRPEDPYLDLGMHRSDDNAGAPPFAAGEEGVNSRPFGADPSNPADIYGSNDSGSSASTEDAGEEMTDDDDAV